MLSLLTRDSTGDSLWTPSRLSHLPLVQSSSQTQTGHAPPSTNPTPAADSESSEASPVSPLILMSPWTPHSMSPGPHTRPPAGAEMLRGAEASSHSVERRGGDWEQETSTQPSRRFMGPDHPTSTAEAPSPDTPHQGWPWPSSASSRKKKIWGQGISGTAPGRHWQPNLCSCLRGAWWAWVEDGGWVAPC